MLSDKIKSTFTKRTTFRIREKIVTKDDENAQVLNSVFSSAGEISEFPNFWKLIR